MDGFDLERLTDHDFELVCKDIFEQVLEEHLEVFAPGPDGGIDLRHLSPNGNHAAVIQCKHWAKSGRSKLLEHYKKKESAKVKALAPERYLIATSATMTPKAKGTLLELLDPYLQTTGDIYGLDELVEELRKHPEIVRRHLRLWLASTAVLETLLSKKVHQRASFFQQDILETLKTYAPTPAFGDATSILDAYHVLVIAGNPGIGKTTLAQVIAATHQAEGFEIYEIANDIDDVLQVWDEDSSQLFYYDDFLGQTSLRDTIATSEDSRLLQLIRRVAQSANKRLVLTTREYILAQARRESEKLTKSRHLELANFVLDVSKYSVAAKAEILYNHLHFSSLPSANLAIFGQPEVYREIISHKNFNPRLVAMTFESAGREQLSPEDSVTMLMANLNDPAELWDHMFNNQMSPSEIDIVTTIFTLGGPVELDFLVETWAESTHSNLVDATRTVRRALDSLEGTLVRMYERESVSSGLMVQLHNPSIRDFLKSRLSGNVLLVRSVIDGICHFEQLANLFAVAEGLDGERLLSHLAREQELVEEVFARTVSQELEGADENRWFGALEKGVNIGLALRSRDILARCENALSGEWPDYSSDPDGVVALIKSLRKAPESSSLRAHVGPATDWLIQDLLHDTSNWSALKVAEATLIELGGPAALSAMASVDEYLFETARRAAESFSGIGSLSDLSEAREMVEVLDEHSEWRDEGCSTSEFRDFVEQATQEAWERHREDRYQPNVPVAQDSAEIAEMMGHLRT